MIPIEQLARLAELYDQYQYSLKPLSAERAAAAKAFKELLAPIAHDSRPGRSLRCIPSRSRRAVSRLFAEKQTSVGCCVLPARAMDALRL
jgi:hypothetical protein